MQRHDEQGGRDHRDEQLQVDAAHDHAVGRRSGVSRKLLVLSSCLFTDRILRYSDCLNVLAAEHEVALWTTSVRDPSVRAGWRSPVVKIDDIPPVAPFPSIAFDYLRRLNEYTWDRRLDIPSRESMHRIVRDRQISSRQRMMFHASKAFDVLGLAVPLERIVQRVLQVPDRSPLTTQRLCESPPNVVVTTSPFRFDEPAIVAAAKRREIPTIAFITSWDNLSTKNRMPFRHDAFLVWSEKMRRELYEFYPYTRDVPVHVIGAPQFDVFAQPRLWIDRADYCRALHLDARRKIILYALGSPNFLHEHFGAIEMAKRVAAGALGDVQLLVRPHPNWAEAPELEPLRALGPRVVVQDTGRSRADVSLRTQDEADIADWVNTFRHADVVVNLSSTVVIDAALCGKPVVNLDYDPAPGGPQHALIKEINHRWNHFAPIAESGGVWLTESIDETIEAVRRYLDEPSLHADRRAWILDYVCGFHDGQCGRRMGEAISQLAAQLS